MGKRHPNHRLVKVHRSYSVFDVAMLFKIHKNTVRAWQKAGLRPIDTRRPVVFLGKELAEFLKTRRVQAKRPLLSGQIYCVACREAKEPALGMADYVPLTRTSGNLRGFCPMCQRFIHRRVSWAKLTIIAGQLDITFTDAPPRISDATQPSLNSDFNSHGSP
jgi:hypothetical protein